MLGFKEAWKRWKGGKTVYATKNLDVIEMSDFPVFMFVGLGQIRRLGTRPFLVLVGQL